MAMSSASCRNLDSPFVTVVLRVAQPSGKIDTRSFEMTVPEFQASISLVLHFFRAMELRKKTIAVFLLQRMTFGFYTRLLNGVTCFVL
jgi:hypothetical protein